MVAEVNFLNLPSQSGRFASLDDVQYSLNRALRWGGHAPREREDLRYDADDVGRVGDQNLLTRWQRHCDREAIRTLRRGRAQDGRAWRMPRHLLEEARRMDALGPGAGGFPRDFEFVVQEVFQEERPVLNGFRLFATDTQVPFGARSYVVRRRLGAGEATLYRAGQEFPRAKTRVQEEQFKTAHIVCSVDTNFFDDATLNWAGMQQYREDLSLAFYLVDEVLNHVIWFGDEDAGLYGILTYPELEKVVFSTPINANANPEIIALALADLVAQPMIVSRGVFKPNRLALAPSDYQHIATRKHAAGTDTKILQYFLAGQADMADGVRSVEAVPELEAIGPNGENGILAYRSERTTIRHQLLQAATTLPVWRSSPVDSITVVYASTGGVVMPNLGNVVLALVPKQ
jgi:hypothetical protein